MEHTIFFSWKRKQLFSHRNSKIYGKEMTLQILAFKKCFTTLHHVFYYIIFLLFFKDSCALGSLCGTIPIFCKRNSGLWYLGIRLCRINSPPHISVHVSFFTACPGTKCRVHQLGSGLPMITGKSDQ